MFGHPKKIIVLASVLKPVDDTRMFEKFALSLSQTNKYDINIIGFSTKNIPQEKNIRFFPIFSFKRLNISRLKVPLSFFLKLLKLKPEIIIIHSHELLSAAVLYRFFHYCRLHYDIQENYALNIIHNKNYPWSIVYLLASWVRLKEIICSRFIDQFYLAEENYYHELHFSRNRSEVILNKFKKTELTQQSNPPKPGHLIYSGTISESYGIFEAIDLTKKLHALNPKIKLTIIGYCAHQPTLLKIRKIISGLTFIDLIGGESLVPHKQILLKIREAAFGIVPHQLNPSITGCFPTKIYEYLAFQKPMILRKYKPWTDYVEKYHGAIDVDFSEPPEFILKKMKNNNFYPNGVDDDIYWEKEAKKLLAILNH